MNKVKQFIKNKEYNVVFKEKVNFKNPSENRWMYCFWS